MGSKLSVKRQELLESSQFNNNELIDINKATNIAEVQEMQAMTADDSVAGPSSPQNMSESSEQGDLIIDESLDLKSDFDKDEESLDNQNLSYSIESTDNQTKIVSLPELIEEDTSTGFKITSIKSIPVVAFNEATDTSRLENISPGIIKETVEQHHIQITNVHSVILSNPSEASRLTVLDTTEKVNIVEDTNNDLEPKNNVDKKRMFPYESDVLSKKCKFNEPNETPIPSTSTVTIEPPKSEIPPSIVSTQKPGSSRRKSLLKPREDDMVFDEVSTIPVYKKPTLENPNKAIIKKVALVRVCADFMVKELGKKSLFMKKKKPSLQKLIEGFNSQF